MYNERGYILNAPNLQRLVIHDLSVNLGPNYFELLLRPLTRLTHLDLSGAEHREGFSNLVRFVELKTRLVKTSFKTAERWIFL